MENSENYNRKLALILGSSSGMGLASAHKLASKDYDLFLVFRERRSRLAAVEAEFEKMKGFGAEVLTFNIDATDSGNIPKVLERIQDQGRRVDLYLHSIARGNLKPMVSKNTGSAVETLSEQDFEITARSMAFSYYSWAREIMRENLFVNGAVCLALSSEGSFRAWPNYAAVSSAKAALEAISRSMAAEFAPHGVRSNILRPGVTDTPALRLIPGFESLLEQTKRRNPNKRMTKPADVADVVYLMSLPEAHWINGAVIPVDGGESIT